MRVAALLALALLATGCERGPAPFSIDAQPRRAARLAGFERRAALSPRRANDAIRLPVPAGAREATLWMTGFSTGALAGLRRGNERCEIRALPSGTTVAAIMLRAGSVKGARWTPARIDCAGDAELELRCPSMPESSETWFALPSFSGLAPAAARSVLMISLDTVRADALGLAGPALEELAAESTRYRNAFSAAPWTLPSHVSVMTGLLPSWHGRWDPKTTDHDLPPVPTLAGLLSEAGWETAAFTGRGSISWALGATRGFRVVTEESPTPELAKHGIAVTECHATAMRAAAWLRSRRPGDPPFLLFWHTYEPHAPYTDTRFDDASPPLPLPPGVAEDARSDWQRYLGDVAAAGEALSIILLALEESGLASATDVVLFSDHGEDFGEHSGGRREDATRHGNGLWDTQLRVPLLVRSPALPPGDRDELVSLVDLFPTVLQLAGAPVPPSQGRSLVGHPGHDAVAAEALYPAYVPHEMKAWREASGLKHVAELATPPVERLFDAASDPLELRDVAAGRPDDAARLKSAAQSLWSTIPPGTGVRMRAEGEEIPPELLESMRSLGYVR